MVPFPPIRPGLRVALVPLVVLAACVDGGAGLPPAASGPSSATSGGSAVVEAGTDPAPSVPGSGLWPVGGCPWLSPVPASVTVVDPFRPPSHRYGPGNRGLEYGVTGGEPVAAVAPGRVVFAGSVAGRAYVVVRHAGDGMRSTYGPLRAVEVSTGSEVAAARRLGEAEVGLHLTARLDGRYLDPQPLLDGRCGRPRLVAGPGPT